MYLYSEIIYIAILKKIISNAVISYNNLINVRLYELVFCTNFNQINKKWSHAGEDIQLHNDVNPSSVILWLEVRELPSLYICIFLCCCFVRVFCIQSYDII